MTELIHIQPIDDDVLVCDSRDIAKGLGIDHSNFLETIKKHQTAIERDFGTIPFKTESSQMSNGRLNPKPIKYALLSDEQVSFIITLSRNNPNVIRFKALLVKAFSQARKQLLANHQSPVPLHIEPSQATTSGQTYDNVILDYMALLREESQSVKSFDDALKLQDHFGAFLDGYKAIQEQEKLLNDMKAKLKASSVSSSIPSANPSRSKAILPSRNQANLKSGDLEALTTFIRKYALSITPTRETHSSRKPKGKAPFSTTQSAFEEQCKKMGIAYTSSAIESILESLGWKRELETPDRWVIYY
jgi:phage regulator Rha-like protein